MSRQPNHRATLDAFIHRVSGEFAFLVRDFDFDGPKAEILLGREANVNYWKTPIYVTAKFDVQGPPWVVVAYSSDKRLREKGLHQAMERRCPELIPSFETREVSDMMGELAVYASALQDRFAGFLQGDGSSVFSE